MATSNQVGIKQLLEAEQKAQEIVNNARKEKAALLRRAREEAEKEVSAYRAKRQKEYEQKLEDQSKGDTASTDDLRKKADQEIVKIEEALQKNTEKVIELLLNAVKTVELEQKSS